MPTYEPKSFSHLLGKVQGLTDNQLRNHFTLYEGYVKKANEIEERITRASLEGANATYAEIRELFVEQTYALNGVVYHELYFSNLGGQGGMPTGKLADTIKRDFGSVDGYMVQMRACALSMRGWAVTALNLRDGKLHNYGLDFHNMWVPAMAVPVMVMDVYEHAYFMDYGTKRPDYVDAFMRNVDWEVCGKRWDTAARMPSGTEVTR